MQALKILLLLASFVVSFGVTSYVIIKVESHEAKKEQELKLLTQVNELAKRELQISIEVKELQKRKLNCEFKTERCPNG